VGTRSMAAYTESLGAAYRSYASAAAKNNQYLLESPRDEEEVVVGVVVQGGAGGPGGGPQVEAQEVLPRDQLRPDTPLDCYAYANAKIIRLARNMVRMI
jgi:hypothetical protein